MTTPADMAPIGWYEAEPSCAGMDLPALLHGFGQMTHSGQMHWQADRPSTTNPVWPVYANPSYAYPLQPFAIVTDRTYSGEGPTLAVWNGENYNFSDGDCFDREFDGTLDGYDAEWLTHYQLEQRLFATPSPGKAERKKLDTDLLATIREAAKTRAEGAITQDGRAVFINYGDSEQQMRDAAEMACPHCGGSGHKDDASPGKADAERFAFLLDRGLELIACECEAGPPRMWTLGGLSQSIGWFPTQRAAIDAAIQQERDK